MTPEECRELARQVAGIRQDSVEDWAREVKKELKRQATDIVDEFILFKVATEALKAVINNDPNLTALQKVKELAKLAKALTIRRIYVAGRVAYFAGEVIGVGIALASELKQIADSLRNDLKDCDPIATSPLILDLDGDGVEADALAFFDHEGDGWTELSRWADEDDGVLVWDRNNDGVINDGSELFGNNTILANGNKAAHGFAALADLDDNGDGVIDASDAAWTELRVMRWTDDNGNGIKDDDEEFLVTLDSLNIESLNTGFTNSNHVDSSGNEHRQEGGYTKTVTNDDGTTETITSKMTDVWFVTSTGATQYDDSDIPTHSTEIEALPDIQGYGRTYNLRDAMALDDATDAEGNSRLTAPYYSNSRTETRSLREMVEDFTAINADGSPNLDKSAREALAVKILHRWAGAESAIGLDYGTGNTSNALRFTTADKVAVIEAFQGGQWRGGQVARNPAYSTAQKVERGYLNHLERLYGNLMLQTHLKDLNDAITVSLKSGATTGSTDIDDYEISFAGAKTILDGESNARLGGFLRSLAATYGQSDWVITGMKATAASWVYEYEYRAEYLADAVFDGDISRANDFEGNSDINVFQTTDGGADRLRGRGGDDIYHLNYGTGYDRINEQWRSNSYGGDANDVIKLAPGIASSKVALSRTRDDLIVALLDANGVVSDSLRVVNFYALQTAKVEKVLFADGTEWDLSVLQSVPFSSGQGSVGADTYDGSLDGQQASLMKGGMGSDVYILGSGSGNDTIDEASYNTGEGSDVDVVRLKSGIAASQVSLSRGGSNLLISLSDTSGTVTDTLTVKNYYMSDVAKIERVELSDGTTVFDAVDFAAAKLPSGYGDTEANTYDGSLDNADGILQGGKGSDVYILGRDFGNDTIDEAAYNGSGGNDVDVVRLKSGLTASDVEMFRTRDNLIIRVLSTDGNTVDSTLTVKNYYVSDAAKIERVELSDGTKIWDADDFADVALADAGAGNDTVISRGGEETDVLDGSNGGNDILRGGGGGDVYLFGSDSDNDVVDEGYRNFGGSGDMVRLKSGITASQVSLSRTKFNLVISLTVSGTVTDTLTIKNYYVSDAAKIERVELSDGTKVWDAVDFAAVNWTPPSYATGTEVSGTSGDDGLYGEDNLNDVFDGDVGGDDTLRGLSGDDIYWLGAGTGDDTIREYYNNSGDAGDVIKIKTGNGTADIRLLRSSDGDDLYVQLLGAADVNGDRAVTDSLTVANYYTDDTAKIERVEFTDGTAWDANDFILARIKGTSNNEKLYGEDNLNDVFDGDVGGNDTLYGYGGDDVYWLGYGTGDDTIREYDANTGDAGDVIKIKSGIGTADVRLVRNSNGGDLSVQLLGVADANGDRAVTDSLTVRDYYTDDSAKIERVEFTDGAAWDANDFILARIKGTSGDEKLYGEDNLNDVFDGDVGGNDTLYGYGGDDVYWLGYGTGDDTIREYDANTGDAGDVIKIKSGIGTADIRLLRSSNGDHLHVQLLGAVDTNGVRAVTDSLTVANYYTDDTAKIERVEFTDGTAWDANDFILARIKGTSNNEKLYGEDNLNDVFDGDVGGNDTLYGYGGDDVYWLGAGTGDDTIREYSGNTGDAGDVIKIKTGNGTADIRLLRSSDGDDLYVQLLGVADANGDRAVTDSLTVRDYYTDDTAKIERVEFTDGTAWDANDFILARIKGTSNNEKLYGEDNLNDVFDGDVGGNDTLYGYGGDDIYWLGSGTGDDTIREYDANTGDAGDVIKIKTGNGTADIRLLRSSDGDDLYVQLLGAADVNGDRAVTDSLTVANYYTDDTAKIERVEFTDGTAWDANDFILARIKGTSNNEKLYGEDNLNDVFDGDVGGNDTLYGYGGDDVYWLGYGTGDDTIREYDANTGDAGDVIKIKSGIGTADVRLVRNSNGGDLSVQLLGVADANGDRAVTDSLTVRDYYTDDSAKIERVEFTDGAAWDANDFILARIKGTSGDEKLYGEDNLNDVFDGDVGGNDTLYGYGGDDVYWLGYGTGDDTIREYDANTGDAGDVIKIKSGIGTADIRLLRSSNGDHLHVQLLGAVDTNGVRAVTDSLTVANYYTDDTAKIERVEFTDGTAWDANDFILARIKGTSNNEKLYGEDNLNDVFDGDVGGNDTLYGYGGDDVYWLGAGTGDDTIREYSGNTGDAGDVIKIKTGNGTADIRLLRSSDGDDLYVQLLGVADANGDRAVTDSLTVRDYYTDDTAKIERVEFTDGTAWDANDFILARIKGTSNNEKLYGEDNLNDVFDGDVGGNDTLYGYGGDDVYWLGYGTGDDTIREYDANTGDAGDVIKIKTGNGTADIRLLRSSDGDDLYVQLLGAADVNGDRAVTDSLTVANYYTDDTAKIERVEFTDGAAWDANDFILARIKGTSGDEKLYGEDNLNDVFDGDVGGNDTLYGYGGDDVYWLGYGTGDDTIREYDANTGDAGDVIKIKSGIGTADIRLLRSSNGDHLHVQLLGAVDTNGVRAVTDSLTVANYYTDDTAKIERVEFTDGTIWGTHEFSDVRTTAWFSGTSGDDTLEGTANQSDVFDSVVGGDDTLRGLSGDDIYWLGVETGDDTIQEYYNNSGDSGDKIKIHTGIGTDDVRLERSSYGYDLSVQLLGTADANGVRAVTDSLTVEDYYTDDSAKIESIEFADGTVWDTIYIEQETIIVEIVGTSGDDDWLLGTQGDDVYDANAGGNDRLLGLGGNDTYWLGYGTDHDTVMDWYRNSGVGDADDKIKIKAGINSSSVRLVSDRHHYHLIVQLLESADANGVRAVSDSLTINSYYTSDWAKIESIEFADGTIWGAHEFSSTQTTAWVSGTSGDDNWLSGTQGTDIYDANTGGNDRLLGLGGNDTYYLGYGTDHDTILDWYLNNGGDTDDKIKIHTGISSNSVRLVRSGDDLVIQLLDPADANGERAVNNSLTVNAYYTRPEGKIESIAFADGTVWDTNYIEQKTSIVVGTSVDDDWLPGTQGDDIYDTDIGGNDRLLGLGGNDTYYLGYGTDHDTILDWYLNNGGDTDDKIKIHTGISSNSVRLVGSGNDLVVQLLDSADANGERAVNNSLTINAYYTRPEGKIESIAFADGTVWDTSYIEREVRIVGTSGNDWLLGTTGADIYDTNTEGDDQLLGREGNDTYRLGRGTDNDVIKEWYLNDSGDTGDQIKVDTGIALTSIRLSHTGNDLVIKIMDSDGTSSNSLRVERHYTDDTAKIEKITAGDEVLLSSQYTALIDEMSLFENGTSGFSSVEDIYGHYWQDASSITNPG